MHIWCTTWLTCDRYFLPRRSSLKTSGSAEDAMRISVSSPLRWLFAVLAAPSPPPSGYSAKLLIYAYTNTFAQRLLALQNKNYSSQLHGDWPTSCENTIHRSTIIPEEIRLRWSQAYTEAPSCGRSSAGTSSWPQNGSTTLYLKNITKMNHNRYTPGINKYYIGLGHKNRSSHEHKQQQICIPDVERFSCVDALGQQAIIWSLCNNMPYLNDIVVQS